MNTKVSKKKETTSIDRTLLKKEAMRVLSELDDLVRRVGEADLPSGTRLMLATRLNSSVGTLRGKVDELLEAVGTLTDEASSLRDAHRNLVARLRDITSQQRPTAFCQD